VLVPSDIRIVKRLLADRGALQPGADITAQAIQSEDGILTASQITVRAMAR
jgi:hypothetical protein